MKLSELRYVGKAAQLLTGRAMIQAQGNTDWLLLNVCYYELN